MLAVLLLGGVVACRHHVVTTPAAEDPCWSYVASSPLPPERVVRRYMDAFRAVGLADPMWFVHSDTAWAITHPAASGDTGVAARYSARIVAYRRGDSARVRQYVTRLDRADSASEQARVCAEITRAAAVPLDTPTAPADDESLAVWRLGTEPR